MKKYLLTIGILAISSLMLMSGCSKKEKTIGGALIGAAAGAGIGSAIGNTEGAVIGGIGGAALGGIIGNSMGDDK